MNRIGLIIMCFKYLIKFKIRNLLIKIKIQMLLGVLKMLRDLSVNANTLKFPQGSDSEFFP